MDKNAIEKYAIWARNELIEQIKQRAYQYGISEADYGEENARIIGETILSPEERRQRLELVWQIQRQGYEQTIEEVAYTWFNRLIALRYLEVNDYLPTHVRVLSDTSGAFKPEILSNVLHLELDGLDQSKVSELMNANKTDDLYRYLLLTQCNAMNKLLPEMFEELGSYTEMLLPNNILRAEGVVGRLVSDIPEEDFKDAVQIIGWLYQYYNTEPKQAVFDGLKKNIKISKENIPAATQLFTPDWIVRYMVENSLGRLWLESHPNSNLRNNWEYYLEEAEQTPEVAEHLQVWRSENAVKSPEDIKVIDPCMGSGHILVYAFDVLMQIYVSEGYTERGATKLILEKNLYGLEIDRRAYQLAYFALMMKARQHNRRILTLGVRPQVYEPSGYADGMEYGSLVRVDSLEAMPQPPSDSQIQLLDSTYAEQLNTWNFRRLLAQKYDVVVTNPPYMGSKGMTPQMAEYVKTHFPDSKSDFFAVFIERGNKMLGVNGFNCMVTMQSWMFLSSYETMRKKIMAENTIVNLMHMENMVLGIAFGTAVVNLKSNYISNYRGQYNHIKLSDINGDKPYSFPPSSERNRAVVAENFAKIPGSPVAYWVSESMLRAFENGTSIGKISDFTGSQHKTADNEKFLRMFWEISNESIEDKTWIFYIKGGEFRRWYGNIDLVIDWTDTARFFYSKNHTSNMLKKPYWFQEGITYTSLTNSANGFRYLPPIGVFDIKGPSIVRVRYLYYSLAFFNSKVANSYIKLLNPTVTLQVKDVKNIPVIIDKKQLESVEAVALENISISRTDWDAFETSWDFSRHPLRKFNVSLPGYKEASRANIETPPHIKWVETSESLNVFMSDRENNYKIESSYQLYKKHVEERFQQLKTNEEELNRIFIDIYGVQDELTPEVDDKDVTVYRVFDSKKDIPESMAKSRYALTRQDVIKSFISYAVGCMFGRYSLDVEGLVFAGGEWDESKYQSFHADRDNIIPISDDDYFTDDMVDRFVTFVRTVYGSKTLEENLIYIAEALGGRGTARDVIRNYFLNDFYKDHVKTYQKRPIYWLFDSGNKNGFKALIYMHRYSRDLIAKLRTDYVHEQQERYRTQLTHISTAIENATGADRVRYVKQQSVLQDQLNEVTIFEEKVHHLADQNIEIDLDDGVKRNYEIFADVLAKI